MMRRLLIVVLALLCGACWDFVEPDFPEAGAPAVLQASVFIDEQGAGNINALLVPGLTFGGFVRDVPNDTLLFYDRALAPTAVRRNGTREYNDAGILVEGDPLAQPFVLVGPDVTDITGPPPRVRWPTIRKIGPDTVSWTRGTTLVLRVDTVLAPAEPPPQIQQWFLDLRGSDRSFRVSSDGLPPAELQIPGNFMPAAVGGNIFATLTFYQSGQQRSPGNDYVGNISFTVLLRWVIKVQSP